MTHSITSEPRAGRSALFGALAVVALVAAAPAPASAQSSTACYKGVCAGLDTAAIGSNYAALRAPQSSQTARGDQTIATFGTSGGDVDTSYLGTTDDGPCVGWATVLPDHIVEVDEDSSLEFAVASGRDTALLVHGPGGWRCNDDAVGTDPAVGGRFAAGTYRVWVASYSRGFHDYELSVTARPNRGQGGQHGHGGHGARGLDATATSAAHESVIYGAGDGDVTLSGRAGGRVDGSTITDSYGVACLGFTHREPDHILTLTDHFEDIQLYVSSPVDATLIVHGPHGWICNDDYENTNPGFGGSLPPGTYRVWVGTYDAQDSGPYDLMISDLSFDYVPEPLLPHFSFQGRFEDLDVAFEGDSPDEIYRDCLAFANGSDSLDWVDDIVVNGRAAHYTASYWSADQLCAIAALNAVSTYPEPGGVSGSIEEVPFDIQCGGRDAQRLLRDYVPRATEGMWIDDIIVNGTPYHNGPSYWSADQAAEIIASGIVDPFAAFVAAGTIEDIPFSFAGDSSAEIQRQCQAFIASAASDQWIDDITVNGQSRHNASGWWNPNDACMIVGSLATER